MNLLKYRQQRNLTQEELAEKSGLSVRTIQRIEAGTSPKGYTLKVLMKALDINPGDLTEIPGKQKDISAPDLEINQEEHSKEISGQANSSVRLLKLVNLSSLPFAFLPPFNILVPLLIILYKKEKSHHAKQIVSIQLLWTVFAILTFLLGTFIRKWFSLDNSINSLLLFGLIACNIFIILKNAAALARTGTLHFHLKSSLL